MSDFRKALVQVRIPADLHFCDLRLRRQPGGDISFDLAVMARVLDASGVPRAAATEDLHSGVIVGWYRMHREQGGAPDPVVEQMIAEVREEDASGAN